MPHCSSPNQHLDELGSLPSMLLEECQNSRGGSISNLDLRSLGLREAEHQITTPASPEGQPPAFGQSI